MRTKLRCLYGRCLQCLQRETNVTEAAHQHGDLKTSVLLAIETSQRAGSVALRTGDSAVHVERLRTHDRHEDDLLAAIDRLCRRCDVSPGDLDAVGVSVGPGGFTGLRIAVTTVKMFAETLGVKIVAVPSALVAAESFSGKGPISVALTSKRGWFWWTVLQRDADGSWAVAGTPGLADADSVDCAGLTAVLADEFLPESMKEACETGSVPIEPLDLTAEACLAAADRMLRAGAVTDPLALNPLYPRQPEAVSLWQQRHGNSSQ